MIKNILRLSVLLLLLCGVLLMSALAVGAAGESEMLAYVTGDAGFGQDNDVRLLDIRRGAEFTRLDLNIASLAWSPDGRYLYLLLSTAEGILRLDVRGGQPEIVPGTDGARCFALAPDGDTLIMKNVDDLLLLDLASGERTASYNGYPAAYDPPGCPLVWRSESIIFPTRNRERDEFVLVAFDPTTDEFAERDSRTLPLQGEDFTIQTRRFPADDRTVIYRDEEPLMDFWHLHSPSLSENDRWLAFIVVGADYNQNLQVLNLDTGTRQIINRQRSWSPAWRP